MASFIDVDGQFINLDHVVKIAPLQDGKCEFIFADGTTKLTLTRFDPRDDVPRNEPIIPAPVGWRVIVGGCGPDEFRFEDPVYEDLIGFKLRVYGDIGAISAQSGDMDEYCRRNRWEHAIISPQGEVMEYDGRWPNVEEFLAGKRREYDARPRPSLDALKAAITGELNGAKKRGDDLAASAIRDHVAKFKEAVGIEYIAGAGEEHRSALLEICRRAGLSIVDGVSLEKTSP